MFSLYHRCDLHLRWILGHCSPFPNSSEEKQIFHRYRSDRARSNSRTSLASLAIFQFAKLFSQQVDTNRPCEFQKASQLFIRLHNRTLSGVAMCERRYDSNGMQTHFEISRTSAQICSSLSVKGQNENQRVCTNRLE